MVVLSVLAQFTEFVGAHGAAASLGNAVTEKVFIPKLPAPPAVASSCNVPTADTFSKTGEAGVSSSMSGIPGDAYATVGLNEYQSTSVASTVAVQLFAVEVSVFPDTYQFPSSKTTKRYESEVTLAGVVLYPPALNVSLSALKVAVYAPSATKNIFNISKLCPAVTGLFKRILYADPLLFASPKLLPLVRLLLAPAYTSGAL